MPGAHGTQEGSDPLLNAASLLTNLASEIHAGLDRETVINRALDAAHAAREVGTPVLAVLEDGDRELAALAAESIEIPPVPELLSPILAVVPLQLLTYHLALELATNPDTMRAHEPSHARAQDAFSL